MGLDVIFWLIILFMILWPQIQHKNLVYSRLNLIKKLENKRKSRVITLIHRQERIGLFGLPIFKFIDIEDSEDVLRAIRMTPNDMPIDLIIHTPGGLVLAAAQIAFALRDHEGPTTVIVPHYAMSGGTLIALAADKIIMDPHAVLGPVDPQLAYSGGALPAASIIKAVEIKGEKKVDDETLIQADVARKAIRQVEDIVFKLLQGKMSDEKAREIARALAEGRWTHDYPITVEEAKALGLPVEVGVPDEVYKLMAMYPQTHQLRPGVEFIPMPYPAPHPSSSNHNRGK